MRYRPVSGKTWENVLTWPRAEYQHTNKKLETVKRNFLVINLQTFINSEIPLRSNTLMDETRKGEPHRALETPWKGTLKCGINS